MRRKIWLEYVMACGLTFAGILFLACAGPGSAQALEDGILAVVNDDVITGRDLRDYMKGVFSQLRIEGKSDQEIRDVMEQYERKGIEQLIDDRLILAAADKSGLLIRPKAIDEKLDEIKKKYPDYQSFLDSILKEGMTISEVRKKIENSFKGQVMVENEVRKKITVNPQEVTEYYNSHQQDFTRKPRVFLSSIYVKTSFGEDPAKAKIEKAMAEISKGREFKVVAGEYSELPSVGEMADSELRPEVRDAIRPLAIGQISDILKFDNGYYIFKVEGRVTESIAGLDQIKDKIYQKLFEDKFRVRFKEWIDGLRKKAYIEIK